MMLLDHITGVQTIIGIFWSNVGHQNLSNISLTSTCHAFDYKHRLAM